MCPALSDIDGIRHVDEERKYEIPVVDARLLYATGTVDDQCNVLQTHCNVHILSQYRDGYTQIHRPGYMYDNCSNGQHLALFVALAMWANDSTVTGT